MRNIAPQRGEARAASALNHPNILTVHEFGSADDVHFPATEFVEGDFKREDRQRQQPEIAFDGRARLRRTDRFRPRGGGGGGGGAQCAHTAAVVKSARESFTFAGQILKIMTVDYFELFWSVASLLAGFAVPVLVIGIFVFMFIRNSKLNRQRTGEIQQFAAQNGFTFFGTASYQSIPGYGYFRLFDRGDLFGRNIENGFHGSVGGYQVSVFDYCYSQSKKSYRLPVVMITSPRIKLPWFSLMPQGKGLLQQIQNALESDINFPSNPVFSDNYKLLSHDQSGVRRVFTPNVLAFFEPAGGDNNNGSFVVEGGGNTILFYRYGVYPAPDQLRGMVDEGLKIANVFAR